MKNTKIKFGLALCLSIVAVALVAVATILHGLEVGFDALYSAATMDSFAKHLSGNAGNEFANFLPMIVIYAASALVVLDVIFVIVKKRPLFLIPALIACATLSDGAYLIVACNDALSGLHPILNLVGIALAAITGLLVFILLLTIKKEARAKAVPEVAEKPEEAASEPLPAYEEEQREEEGVEEEPVEEKPVEAKPAPAKKADAPASEEKKVEKKEEKKEKPASKSLGKYEVFPEAGFYKYRLKANNGEILLVSSGYRTREGAKNGIATLKKNVDGGISKVITDKNGYSQFRIFTPNDSRLVAAGEFYGTAAAAQKALASVQRFYGSEKIVDLEEIPEEEVREWRVDLPPLNPNKSGKLEIFLDEETSKWQGRLIANNGAVLFITATYSSKNALNNALNNIKAKVLEGDMDIARDKMNRYHFHVVSENGAVLLMGETYPSRDSAISAAVSVRNFIGDAKVVDLTK